MVEDIEIIVIWLMGVMPPITIPSAASRWDWSFRLHKSKNLKAQIGASLFILPRYAPQSLCHSDHREESALRCGKNLADYPVPSADGEIPLACGPRNDNSSENREHKHSKAHGKTTCPKYPSRLSKF
jgi:hypothetical protein